MTHPITYPSRVVNVLNYAAKNDSTGNNVTAYNACKTALGAAGGIIYFPAGRYRFTAGITLPSNVVIRGDRADRTALIFDLGVSPANCISATGTASAYRKITAPAGRMSKTLTVDIASDFTAGDYADINSVNPWDTQPYTTWAVNSPGQIVQVTAKQGLQLSLAEPLLTALKTSDTGRIRKITPVHDAGVENLRVTRVANSTSGYNIYFGLSVNCWVKGIESRFSAGAHILTEQSAHIEISGNYINNGFTFDGAATHGYGVCLITQSSFVKVENNVFRYLRHHVIMKQGACGNVAAYNYCREPHRSEYPNDAGMDLGLHGFRAAGNLYESNIAGFIQVTETWGSSGAINTFFRNRLELYGIYISEVTTGTNRLQSDSVTFVANDATDTVPSFGIPTGNYILYGSGHFQYANRIRGVLTPAAAGSVSVPEKSLYLNAAPAWWGNQDVWGGIGYPNAYGQNKIPALRRWEAGGLLFVPSDTSRNTAVSCAAPSVSLTGQAALCPGGSVTLTSSKLYGNLWSNGAVTTSITVNTPGSYKVQSVSGGCTSVASAAVVVTQLSAIPNTVTASGPLSIIEGDSVQLSAPSGYTYLWSNGAQSRSIYAQIAGTYTVTVISGACSATGSAVVTVLPPPDLTVAGTVSTLGRYNNIQVSAGGTLTLSGNLNIAGTLTLFTGASLVTGCKVLTGSGSFVMQVGSKLTVCNPDGISLSGNSGAVRTARRSYAPDADYVFNGTASQVTGNGLPARISSLETQNPVNLLVSGPVSISKLLSVKAGVLNMNGQAVTLLASATSTACLGPVAAGALVTNAEQFKVQSYLSAANLRYGGVYYMAGSPVTGKTVSDYAQKGNVFAPLTFVASEPAHSSVWLYNNGSNTFPQNGGWVKPASGAEVMAPGKGARIWFNSTFFASGSVTELQGSPVTGNVSLPVSYCSGACAGNSQTNGWNLVANPYPCTIDWDSPDWQKQRLGGAVYIYRHGPGVYASYTGGIGVNGGSRYLAAGQAFMVQATAANPVLTATEQVKTLSPASELRTGANVLPLLRFSISGNNLTDELVVAHRPGAAKAFDAELDAAKINNDNLNMWAETEPGLRQSIASLELTAPDTIPLVLQSTFSGEAALQAELSGEWPQQLSLSLLDSKTGMLYTLPFKEAPVFPLQAGQPCRLSLLVQAAGSTGTPLINNLLQIYPNPAKAGFTVHTARGFICLQITDVLGREVYNQAFGSSTVTASVYPNLPAGVYRVSATGASGTLVQKLVLE